MSKKIDERTLVPANITELENRIDSYIQKAPAVSEPRGWDVFTDTVSPWEWDLDKGLGLTELGLAPSQISQMPEWVKPPVKKEVTQAWDSVTSWIWSLVSPGSLSKASADLPEVDVLHFGTNPELAQVAPVLDVPEELTETDVNHFIKEMNQLLTQIKSIIEESGEEMQFEALLLAIYRSEIAQGEEKADMSKDRIIDNNQRRREAQSKLHEAMKDMQDKMGQTKLWGSLEKAVTTIGLTTAAASVSSGWGVAGLLFGIGVIGDDILGDPVKASLATLMSGGDVRSEEEWLERLRLGAGVVSAITLLAIGQTTQLNQASSAARGITQGMHAWKQNQTSHANADITELGQDVTKKSDAIKKALNENKKAVKTISDFFSQLHSVQKSQLDVAVSMIRR